MKKENNRTPYLKFSLAALLALSLSLTFARPTEGQQGQPELQINTPVDGTIVNPGQTITVNVTSPAGTAFTQVAVIGEGSIPSSDIAISVPAQFSIVMPNSLSPRKYHLTAVGKSSSGQLFASRTSSIDVERPDAPIGIAADRSQVAFQCVGQQTRLRVLATFADASALDVTESSNVSYASANTSVATVDSDGIVSGVGAGSASVTATYGQGTSSLVATVSVSVPPPALSASPASRSFGNQAVGSSSSSQPVSVTNVSKNQGLKISGVSTTGDFSETDNCVSPTPLVVGASCTINVTFAPTAAGSRTGAINISNGQTVSPFPVPLTGTGTGITKQATSVLVASSASPSVYGQSVTLTATVSPSSGSTIPTGTVTFLDGSNTVGAATLANARAAFTLSTFAVASHPITATYSGDNFFLGSTSSSFLQTLTPAALSVTANNASRQYGQANPVFSGTISGIQNGDNVTATYASVATSASPVGTYAIVPTLVDPTNKLGNYSVTSNNGTLTVKPTPLTITANNATKTFNASNPALTWTASGFVNGEGTSVLTPGPTCTTTATTASPAGSYPITCSGANATNYAISYVSGTLTVTCHYVSITLSPSSVAVGGTVAVTGTMRSCTSSTQTVAVQFTLAGPLQPGSCSSTSSVMYTTPSFTLAANTQKTVSFPFRVPNNTCPGSYTVTAKTSVGGIAVDSSSAALVVTAH